MRCVPIWLCQCRPKLNVIVHVRVARSESGAPCLVARQRRALAKPSGTRINFPVPPNAISVKLSVTFINRREIVAGWER
jgi:hypothetical protein